MKTVTASLLSLGLVGMISLTSCITAGNSREQMVPKPLATDTNELHWRMYFQEQFDAYGKAPPPAAGAPDVAWTAYMAEKDSYAIRLNNQLLRKHLRQQEKDKKKD